MPRPADKYGNRRGAPRPDRGPPLDADVPVAGYFLIRLVRDGPPCGLRIWFGPPLDPESGQPLDRSPGWWAQINGGRMRPAAWFWPECARVPITRDEHDRLCALARTLDPRSPFYDPPRPIDPLASPPPF